MNAYSTTSDGTWFVPTDLCRGPWDEQSCHAGPPTGLVARAMEGVLSAETDGRHRLVRLSVELLRPVPMAGFAVAATADRLGRGTASLDARIVGADDRVVAVARGIAIAPRDLEDVPTPLAAAPELAEARPGPFPLAELRHDRVAFTESVELRYPPGQSADPGPTTVWMRAAALVEGEEPSPFQAICPLADCGNAISRNAEPGEWGFVNPDLTVTLHRPPTGDWFGAEAISHWQPSGIGMSDALLFDTVGVVGRAVQTLVLDRSG